jgi:hypothetical protein
MEQGGDRDGTAATELGLPSEGTYADIVASGRSIANDTR